MYLRTSFSSGSQQLCGERSVGVFHVHATAVLGVWFVWQDVKPRPALITARLSRIGEPEHNAPPLTACYTHTMLHRHGEDTAAL